MTNDTPGQFKSPAPASDGVMVIRSAPDTPHRAARRVLLLLACVTLAVAGWGPFASTASADTAFTFSGGGWGHGVGMSQWGARGMAAQGSSASQILTHYYRGTAVSGGAVNDDLRVLLGVQSSFTLTAGGTTTFGQFGSPAFGSTGAGGVVTVGRSGGSVTVSGAVNGSAGALVVSFAGGGGPLRVTPPNHRYAYGTLVITPDAGGGLRAVLVGLGMQQYLYGLGEVPSSWPTEALRAQAIAGRTFAQKQVARANRSASDFDLYGGLPHQTYLGWEKEGGAMGNLWRAAVDDTNGVLVTYGGALIDAVYSASSGGHTENSEVVWVSAVPYLRGVPDPADGTGGNPNGSWTRTYSGSQLGSWFGIGQVTDVQVLGPLGVSGRVDRATIRLVGTGGTKDVTGASFRTWVNSASPGAQLLSSRFTVGGTPAAPPAPGPNTAPFGVLDGARADGRTIIVHGRALDPDGAPVVRVTSTMGTQVAVRDVNPLNGMFLAAWTGSPGTRTVCVSLLDTVTGQATALGCRNVVVK